jgi:hypothetical protein
MTKLSPRCGALRCPCLLRACARATSQTWTTKEHDLPILTSLLNKKNVVPLRRVASSESTRASGAAAATAAATSGYRLPAEEIQEIVLAAPEPLYSFSPDRRFVLQLDRPPLLPSVVELARPELKLAGKISNVVHCYNVVNCSLSRGSYCS